MDKSSLKLEAINTPGISTEEKPMVSRNIDSLEKASIKPSKKAKKLTKTKRKARNKVKNAKTTILIIGICSSIILQHVLLLKTIKK